VKQIRTQVEETTSDYDREKLQERLAKLVGGVAVIKVGAATETEMKEKKARVEDAMHATKAAVEEGIVPGGGVALIRASKALDSLKLEGDQKVGVNIIRKAIEEPLRWIATNAGRQLPTSKKPELKDWALGVGIGSCLAAGSEESGPAFFADRFARDNSRRPTTNSQIPTSSCSSHVFAHTPSAPDDRTLRSKRSPIVIPGRAARRTPRRSSRPSIRNLRLDELRE
jgi:hypothetical protein